MPACFWSYIWPFTGNVRLGSVWQDMKDLSQYVEPPSPNSMTRSPGSGGGIDSHVQVFTLRQHRYGLVIQLHMGDILCSLFWLKRGLTWIDKKLILCLLSHTAIDPLDVTGAPSLRSDSDAGKNRYKCVSHSHLIGPTNHLKSIWRTSNPPWPV